MHPQVSIEDTIDPLTLKMTANFTINPSNKSTVVVCDTVAQFMGAPEGYALRIINEADNRGITEMRIDERELYVRSLNRTIARQFLGELKLLLMAWALDDGVAGNLPKPCLN